MAPGQSPSGSSRGRSEWTAGRYLHGGATVPVAAQTATGATNDGGWMCSASPKEMAARAAVQTLTALRDRILAACFESALGRSGSSARRRGWETSRSTVGEPPRKEQARFQACGRSST